MIRLRPWRAPDATFRRWDGAIAEVWVTRHRRRFGNASVVDVPFWRAWVAINGRVVERTIPHGTPDSVVSSVRRDLVNPPEGG